MCATAQLEAARPNSSFVLWPLLLLLLLLYYTSNAKAVFHLSQTFCAAAAAATFCRLSSTGGGDLTRVCPYLPAYLELEALILMILYS